MASTSAQEDSEAGYGFGAEDFISFDFVGDANVSEDAIVTGDESRAAVHGTKGNDGDAVGSSSSNRQPNNQKGKKRKFAQEFSADAANDGMTKKERERAAARGTPWTVDVNWETAKNAAQQLNRELIAFESWLSPTRREHECRQMVIDLIRQAITAQWRDAKVYSFGSQDTELYLPQGDIDLVVVSNYMELQRREGVLRSMAACLRRNNLATDVQVIAKAKVPIIKFVCTYGKYRCDISVNQTNGLLAADYVNDMQSQMPAIRPLILITKHLLQQRGMSEVYTGGLGSFSVILLIINFMQIHPKVQRGEIDPCRNLGVLFLDFLELFGKNFGYDDTGVRVSSGGGYFSKSRRGWVDQGKPYKLSIEDPQSADNDISKGSYNILSIRSALGGAFDLLTSAVCKRGQEMSAGLKIKKGRGSHLRFQDGDAVDEEEAARRALVNDGSAGSVSVSTLEKDPQSLLSSIIGVSKDLMKRRKDIASLHDSGVLQAKLGRSPPGRSPSPGPSSHSERFRSTQKDRPRSPSAPPPSIPPPPPKASGSGVNRVINVRGAASQQPLHSTPRRGKGTVSSLRDRIEPARGESDDDDEADSRYIRSRSNEQRKSARREERSGGVARRYVSEESSSEGEAGSDGNSSEEEGLVRSQSSKESQKRGQRQRSRDYWLSKSTSGRFDDDSDG